LGRNEYRGRGEGEPSSPKKDRSIPTGKAFHTALVRKKKFHKKRLVSERRDNKRRRDKKITGPGQTIRLSEWGEHYIQTHHRPKKRRGRGEPLLPMCSFTACERSLE